MPRFHLVEMASAVVEMMRMILTQCRAVFHETDTVISPEITSSDVRDAGSETDW
jgi:hypothetical protein